MSSQSVPSANAIKFAGRILTLAADYPTPKEVVLEATKLIHERDVEMAKLKPFYCATGCGGHSYGELSCYGKEWWGR